MESLQDIIAEMTDSADMGQKDSPDSRPFPETHEELASASKEPDH